MPALHVEALIFSLCWAALAIFGGIQAGWLIGAALSVGLLAVIMPTSSLILSRTENFRLERQARWGILLTAALLLAVLQVVPALG
jgi:hypothetical protein